MNNDKIRIIPKSEIPKKGIPEELSARLDLRCEALYTGGYFLDENLDWKKKTEAQDG